MRYPGGKGKSYQRLINLMPPHETYIESHLGGGAVLRHKRPAAANIGIDIDETVVATWKDRFPGLCELIQTDAVEFLQAYRFTGRELVYADPPYLPSTRRRHRVYTYDYSEGDHNRLLDVLLQLPCSVMISGYQSVLYSQRLRHWRIERFQAKTHIDVRTEHVWMNFDPPAQLHDSSHLGATFRERQSHRRRHARWIDRFKQLDPVERSHLLSSLNAAFPSQGTKR